MTSSIGKKEIPIDRIININVNNKTIENRIISRSKIEKREDDSLNVIKNRISNYYIETKPVVQIYKEKYPLVFSEINGEQKIEKIQSDILNIAKKC